MNNLDVSTTDITASKKMKAVSSLEEGLEKNIFSIILSSLLPSLSELTTQVWCRTAVHSKTPYSQVCAWMTQVFLLFLALAVAPVIVFTVMSHFFPFLYKRNYSLSLHKVKPE